ncbi:MAG: SemiSWEET transporter [Bacteroidota bacterium]
MNFITIIGSVAATCTTVSFIPQVLKILKTHNTEGVSLKMYIVFTIGVICWLTYGILLNEWPIILSNSATLVLAGIILFCKVKYG